MPKFTHVRLQNFLSHADTEVQLSNCGLVLVTGRVEDSAASSSNGAGKSAIIEAIVFALYGRTLRGVRGTSVVRRQAGGKCLVELGVLSDDGREVVICRPQEHTLKPSVTVDGEIQYGVEAIDRIVAEVIGYNFETFIAALIFGKGNTKFITQLGDADLKKILDEVQGLQDLQGFAKTAKGLADATDAAVLEGTQELTKTTALVAAAVEHCQVLREAAGAFEAQTEAERTQLLAEERQAEAVLQDAKKACRTAEARYGVLGKVPNVSAETARLQQLHNQALDERETATRALGGVAWQKDDFARKLANIQRLEVDECPSCFQKVSLEHKARLVAAWQNDLAAAQEQWQIAEEAVRRVDAICEARRRDVQDALRIVEDVKHKTALAALDLRRAQGTVATAQQLGESIRQRLQALNGRKNMAAESLVGAEERLRTLQATLAELQQRTAPLQERAEILAFWRKALGPGGVRSWILDNSIPFLNERAKHYSELFTDSTVRIAFSTQETLKSGEVRERFSVQVDVAEGGGDYTECSDGQRRRADIIATLALGDLAAARVGKPINLALFDEVFDGLDATGMERAIAVLSSLAETRESLFVISHADGLQSYFPTVLTVVNRHGVSEVQA